MLPRFLVVSKYELRQYRGNYIDQAIIILVLLAGFMMLITPEVKESSLPSSHNIYRIGYVQGTVIGRMSSYSLEFVPFADQYDMMQASGLNKIDAFVVYGRNGIVVFGSGTRKSDAALSHMNQLLGDFNAQLVSEYIANNSNLSGVLLPLRLQVFNEEINYSSAINGSMELRRREVLGVTRLGESDEAARLELNGSTEIPAGVGGRLSNESAMPAVTVSPGAPSNSTLSFPEDLSVEFPFKTLYKNMTLLSPIILLSFLLSLSLSRERIDRNIENLFDAPLTNAEILLGKATPYLSAMAVLSLVYGLQTSWGPDALKVAIVFFVLSCTMVSFSLFSVLISRSYRELTFIGSFSMFAFFFFIILPNVFSGVNALSFISPLDTITSIENGALITYTDIFLSLLPYGFLSMFFLSFTGVCFNAEVIFSSMSFRSLLELFYTRLARTLQSGAVYAVVSVALLVPFVFIVESILAYLVLPLGNIAPLISLMLLATVEELVKILPYYHKRINPLVYGILAGSSFFLMEKLFNLYLIFKVYSYLGGPYVLFFQKLLPTLFLHILSTTIFAAIIWRSRRLSWLIIGLFVSVSMHVTFNYLVLAGII